MFMIQQIDMLVIKTTTPSKSFEDFNNMFKAIHPQSYSSTYIAILVYNKVALERNPIRTNEVNTWLNGGRQQYEFSSDEESLSDITD